MPRKLPNQNRSKKKVEKIIAATVKLLEKTVVEGITTNHIARKAGIPVASLYQYFPNKHAVVYAVFQQWLDWVMSRFDAIESRYYQKTSCEAFFGCLVEGILENTRFAYGAENQLSRAMNASPMLAKLDRQHGDAVALRLAGYLKGYGSDWPEEDLIKVGHLLYRMTSLLYDRFREETLIERKQLLGWNRTMINALISDCLKKSHQGI